MMWNYISFYKYIKRVIISNILVLFVFNGTIYAEDPYCGIYCVYTILKMNNKKVDFQELLKPKYVGSAKGSTISELKIAAEEHGLYVAPIVNLNSTSLKKCKYPAILHVKSNAKSVQYDHFILFIGTENRKVKIFEPPESVKLISFAELTSRWDGTGLVISVDPINLSSIFIPYRKKFVMYSTFLILVIFIIRWAKRFLPVSLSNSRIKLMGLSIVQAVSFAIAAVLIGLFYHFTNEVGLLANANTTSSIQQAYQGSFIPKIAKQKVEELLDTNTVFIDARFARDYEAGHLEGAISVPIDSNDVERYKATVNISKDTQIVMYCQSAGCKYAEKVAIKLQEDGFKNISIYKGGWMDWKEKNIKEEKLS